MTPFLKWLLGLMSIGTAIYCSLFFPDNWLLPQKFVMGVIVTVIAGWCYVSLIPLRILGFPKQIARARAVTTLILIALLHLLRPDWLSGNWLGWAGLPLSFRDFF